MCAVLKARTHRAAAGWTPEQARDDGVIAGVVREAETRSRNALLLFPVGALLLAACGVQVRDKASEAKAQSHEKAIEQAEGRIECAPEGAAQFAYVCAIDRVQSQDGLYLTLRQPDGGFRRLLVTKDGRGVIAADGAEQVVVMPLTPDRIEVAIGGSRYRLPATVRGGGQ